MYKKVLVVVATLATLAVSAVVGQSAFAADRASIPVPPITLVVGNNAPFLSLVDGAPLHEYTIRVTIVVRAHAVTGVSGVYLHCDAAGANCTVDTGTNMFTAAIKGLNPQAVAAVRDHTIDALAFNGGQGEATDRAIADMYKRSLKSAVAKAVAAGHIPA
ncbi:hypothetical protein Val02_24010 [Virgisporangium aliadipatigenens]|uniref:Uncharacterized protein n=1 Tax=Virgisporangium aliadipatigenens TaxID=741659 RepID=A0A8J3YK80_9ACTN|nr:hypothetical protein [Virgisporangium aliadipatigenens]GIJ45515.1 hypothetical protein Val02_24010 [Virgisporangium aliadipatigenens]